MICEICRHCGLCEGDGKSSADEKMTILSAGILPFKARGGEIADSKVCIAVDIGTTTIAAACYSLSTQECLESVSSVNPQRAFGNDVVSRIQFALSGGAKKLRDCVVCEVNSLLSRLLAKTSLKLPRGFRPETTCLCITGNTTMLSLAFALDVSSLALAPFSPPSTFGKYFLYGDFISGARISFPALSPDTPLFVPHCAGAFFGADAICTLVACGFGKDDKVKIAADVGTNCEMALQLPTGKIICTASAAGPAFEGCGIEFGMSAKEGAIASAAIKDDGFGNKAFEFSVIGKTMAKGICGTGLLSALSVLLTLDLVDKSGEIKNESGVILLRDGVTLSQKDIRALQLAKSAVKTGLDFLVEKCPDGVAVEFFLAGGFGTTMKIEDATSISMIPHRIEKNAVAAGNTALSGAAAIMLESEMKERALRIFKNAECVNLADLSDFQERFISNLDF